VTDNGGHAVSYHWPEDCSRPGADSMQLGRRSVLGSRGPGRGPTCESGRELTTSRPRADDQKEGSSPMARSQNPGNTARDEVPDDPTDLSGGSWLAAAKRGTEGIQARRLQDRCRGAKRISASSRSSRVFSSWSTCLGASRQVRPPAAHHEPGQGRLPASVRRSSYDVTHLQHSHAGLRDRRPSSAGIAGGRA